MTPKLNKWLPFLTWGREINRQSLSRDLMAGLTGAVIALPQGVAYALIAGLPPEYGLYSAIVTCILASLFGSSHHMVSGPTAALSIVVMSVVGSMVSDPQNYIASVMTLTLIVGVIQLAFGLLRLGSLVNFISHTVVIGFTAGAAILIAASQLKHLLGVQVESGLSFIGGLNAVIHAMPELNGLSVVIGLVTLGVSVLIRRINRRLPHMLIGLGAGSLACLLMSGAQQGVALVGALPHSLPPFSIPDMSAESVQRLTSGAFAIALLGLIEAVSIGRAIALRSQQRIDGNQEFIGQGISNLVGSFFSCFAGSGSFTRSGANYDAGAQTPLAAISSSLILVVILLLIPGITAYLPMPAMAGAILLISWNLIDFHHIREILKVRGNEAMVLAVTFLSTLFVELEFAIYVGVILSLALYLRRTSRPTVMEVAPVQNRPERWIRNVKRYQLEQCPQLKILRIDGSLFFGAVDHVQQQIRQLTEDSHSRVLIIGKGINFIDIAGVEMLIQEARRLEQRGGQLVITSLKGTVIDELKAKGYLDKIGAQRITRSPSEAFALLLPTLDSDTCASCEKRIFNECAVSGARCDDTAPLNVRQ